MPRSNWQRKKAKRRQQMEAAAAKGFRIVGASEQFTIRAEETGEGDAKKTVKKFEGTAYTGAAMRLWGFYYPVVVDLAGMQVPNERAPVFRNHDSDRIVGHSEEVTVLATKIKIKGVISGVGPDAQEILALSGNDFPWQMSIGANATRMELVDKGETVKCNGRTFQGPIYVARGAIYGESSFVPLGADGATSATVAAAKSEATMFDQWLQACGIDASKLTPEARAKLEKRYNKMQADFKKASTSLTAEESPDDDDDEDDMPKKADAAAVRKELTEGFAKMQAEFKAEMEKGRKEQERQTALGRLLAAEPTLQMEVEEKGVKKKVGVLEHAIAAGWDVERTELQMRRLADIRGERPKGPHFHMPTAPVADDAVLEAAVFQAAGQQALDMMDDEFYKANSHRGALPTRLKRQVQGEMKARYTDQVLQAAHTLYRGRIGLQQMLCAVARRTGYRGSEVIRGDEQYGEIAHHCMLRAEGASYASIANTLANVLNKMMLPGYLYVESAWRDIAGIRPVKDFKATKSINLFGDFEFKPLGASGELIHAALQDQAFANQVDTKGRLITIDRKHIINDDLGALTRIPMLLGRGAGLRLNKEFWTEWLDTTNKDNGGSTDFWASTHTITGEQGKSNLISGGSSALSSAALQTALETYYKQVDPMGDPLGLDLSILLYPPELDQTAWELLNSSFVVGPTSSKQPNANRWVNKYRPVMSRYLSNTAYTGNSATAWWLLVDPGVMAAIEVAFLNGVEAPTVQTAGPDFQFNMLGISTRGYFDIGVNIQNFRAGVKSAGA